MNTIELTYFSDFFSQLVQGKFLFTHNRCYLGFTALTAAMLSATLVLACPKWALASVFVVNFGYMVWLGGRGTIRVSSNLSTIYFLYHSGNLKFK